LKGPTSKGRKKKGRAEGKRVRKGNARERKGKAREGKGKEGGVGKSEKVGKGQTFFKAKLLATAILTFKVVVPRQPCLPMLFKEH